MWVGVSTQPLLLAWDFCFTPCLPAPSRPSDLGPRTSDQGAALMWWAAWLLSPRRSVTWEPVCGGFDLSPVWGYGLWLKRLRMNNTSFFILLKVRQLCAEKLMASFSRRVEHFSCCSCQIKGRKPGATGGSRQPLSQDARFFPSSDWLMMADWMFAACLHHLLWIKRWTITHWKGYCGSSTTSPVGFLVPRGDSDNSLWWCVSFRVDP